MLQIRGRSAVYQALAMDAAGNVSNLIIPYVEHRIDHTSPLNPANFAVSAEIHISQDGSGTETDLAYYKV